MKGIVEERRREREELIKLARRYADDLSQRVEVIAAAVAGSVARGDFNLWSDVDVVVVANDLPERTPDRMTLLMNRPFPPVQPVGFTPSEFRIAIGKRNQLACEAVQSGVPLFGDLRALIATADGDGPHTNEPSPSRGD